MPEFLLDKFDKPARTFHELTGNPRREFVSQITKIACMIVEAVNTENASAINESISNLVTRLPQAALRIGQLQKGGGRYVEQLPKPPSIVTSSSPSSSSSSSAAETSMIGVGDDLLLEEDDIGDSLQWTQDQRNARRADAFCHRGMYRKAVEALTHQAAAPMDLNTAIELGKLTGEPDGDDTMPQIPITCAVQNTRTIFAN